MRLLCVLLMCALPAWGKFYLHTMEDLERAHPDLAGCAVSVFAGSLNFRLEFNRFRTLDENDADVVILAPYGATMEPHYPHHGGGGLIRDWKDEKRCFSKVVEVATVIINQSQPLKKVVFFASNEGTWNIESFRTTVLGQNEHYYKNVIFACEGFFRKDYRPNIDISFPLMLEMRPEDFKARLNGASAPPLLLSYMGNIARFTTGEFGRHRHARITAKEKLHNPSEGVLIIDYADTKDVDTFLKPRYPLLSMADAYWQIMFDSRFVLVIGGDRMPVSRYYEAVCSGSIPVLLNTIEPGSDFYDSGKALEPPLQQIYPLEWYSIEWNASKLSDLVTHLRSLDVEHVESLRYNSSYFCFNHFSSMERLADTIAFVTHGCSWQGLANPSKCEHKP